MAHRCNCSFPLCSFLRLHRDLVSWEVHVFSHDAKFDLICILGCCCPLFAWGHILQAGTLYKPLFLQSDSTLFSSVQFSRRAPLDPKIFGLCEVPGNTIDGTHFPRDMAGTSKVAAWLVVSENGIYRDIVSKSPQKHYKITRCGKWR